MKRVDINKLFKSGERACGRVMRVLPADEIGSPKQYMMEILKDETLPSLDIIYPRLYSCTVDPSNLIEVTDDQHSGYKTFRIPPELTEGLDIMGIKSCNPVKGGNINTGFPYTAGYGGLINYTNKYGRHSSSSIYEQVMSAQLAYADAQLVGSVTNSYRCKFYPPNILLISEPYRSSLLNITFLLKNDPHLISIPDTAYEAIKRLFILDIKRTIWNEYSILNQVETPYGTIDLKIDDWSNAESERNELFDNLLSTAHIRNSTIISG